MEGNAYNYFAFISYKREDEKWAKWLQKKLESYRLPSVLQKQYNLGVNKIAPVFRDKTDLSTGTVKGALLNELNCSKYLIVISSPRSAASAWVDFEVKRFIELGREKYIIPFIIDGEPNSPDLEKECFSPSLRSLDDQLLGVSVREVGRRTALIRVIAGLLEIRADELIKRERKRIQRKKLLYGTAAVILLSILVFLWSFLLPHKKYYADYVLRNGVPEGIFQLSSKQVKAKNEVYIIVKRLGHVEKLIHANSAGTPIPPNHTERADRPMIAEFSYENEQISTVKYLDRNGNVVQTFRYSGNLKAIDFTTVGDSSAAETLKANTTAMLGSFEDARLTRSNITRYKLEYDDNGFVIREMYMRDNRNTPASDVNGIYGVEYVRDGYGRISELRYLDEKGDYYRNKYNVRGKRYKYDDAGNLTYTEYFSPDNVPTLNEQGWMICRADFDPETGNIGNETFLDGNGFNICNAYGYPGQTFYYDNRGNLTQVHYNGYRNINGIYGIKYSYDTKGQVIAYENYGANLEPEADVNGIVNCRLKHDKNGNITEWRFFNGNNNASADKNNVSIVKAVYENGAMTEQSFFGIDDKPILNANGYAKLEIEYRDPFTESERRYYGINGEKVINTEGYAKAVRFFDDRGNFARIEYYGTNNELKENTRGYAVDEFSFDEKGNLQSNSYYGSDRNPCVTVLGFAKLVYTCDDYGNTTSTQCLDASGQPVISAKGYSREESAYDKWGNVTSDRYLGLSGEPADSANGFSSMTAMFASKGKSIEVCYRRADGSLVEFGGSARITTAYNSFGYPVDVRYFGADNRLKNGPQGFAEISYVYDENGRYIKPLYYDADGNDVTEETAQVRQ